MPAHRFGEMRSRVFYRFATAVEGLSIFVGVEEMEVLLVKV